MAQDIEVWEQKYKPIRNPRHEEGSGYEYEWNTYGKDYIHIQNVYEEAPDRIWTAIDNNDGWYGVVAGWHYVNRISYRITEIPWADENEEYTIYDTGPLRETWEELPIEAIEEIVGENMDWPAMTDEEIEDYRDSNFYKWEEMHELERDEIIAKYKQDGTETKSK